MSEDQIKPAGRIVAFCHSPCIDGGAAAWSLDKKYGDSLTLVGIDHRESNREEILAELAKSGAHEIIFADFVPHRPIVKEIADAGYKIQVYDHHSGAIEEFKDFSHPNVSMVLDASRSGGEIVFDELIGGPRPQGIEISRMLDLEEENKPDYLPVSCFVSGMNRSNLTASMEDIRVLNLMTRVQIVEKGNLLAPDILRRQQLAMATQVKGSVLGDPVILINANPRNLSWGFTSEMGHMAKDQNATVVAWFKDGKDENGDDIVRLSIRGTHARAFAHNLKTHGMVNGAGGHEERAGAQCTGPQLSALIEAVHAPVRQTILERAECVGL